ncbi:MAG: sugar phosphate nucleotidyltransferase, partial [Bacteroidales bacterium]
MLIISHDNMQTYILYKARKDSSKKKKNTTHNSGIEDITIVLGGESVGDFIRLLGDGSKFGANFNYVYQAEARGIAEALYLTRKIVAGHKVAVILGDNALGGLPRHRRRIRPLRP